MAKIEISRNFTQQLFTHESILVLQIL